MASSGATAGLGFTVLVAFWDNFKDGGRAKRLSSFVF